MAKIATKASLRSLMLAIFACLVVVAGVVHMLDQDQLQAIRFENKSFVRQMNSAFHMGSRDVGLRVFSYWNTAADIDKFKEGPIHLSYSMIPNWPNALIARIAGDKITYSIINFWVGCFQISLYGAILFCTVRSGKNLIHDAGISSGFLAAFAAFLFLTNPSSLMMLIEPDFEDSFIFLVFVGCLAVYFGAKKSSNFAFWSSSFLYPLGGGAVIGAFVLSNLGKFFPGRKASIKSCSKIVSEAHRLPLRTGLSVIPFVIGLASYFVARSLYLLLAEPSQVYSGGSVFSRAALELGDDFYGGVLGLLRFLVPISGVPEKLIDSFDLRGLSLDQFWMFLNHIQLAIVYAVISLTAFVFALMVALKKNSPVANKYCIIPNFFLIVTVGVLVFLPQWSSVHFRLVARFFAPAMSFYLAYLTCMVAERFRPAHHASYVLVAVLGGLISLEQLHFFVKWMAF